MQNTEKTDSMATTLLVIALCMTIMSCYWQAAPWLAKLGWSNFWVNQGMLLFRELLMQVYSLKMTILVLIACCAAIRTGKKKDYKWRDIILYSITGIALFMYSPRNGIIYTITSLTGFGCALYGFSAIARMLKNADAPSDEEGFEQTTKLKDRKDSINIPYTFTYRQRQHKGWINCINPYRATAILGSPGSGKSFAVYNAFIEQTLRKGFTMFVYDYKFPDLTERVLTEIAYQYKHEGLWRDLKKKPQLYIINFDDPLKSNRCNPIHHTYISDPADTTEIADLVFKNINKGSSEKGFDFFNESAKVYLDAIIWWLANYDPDALYNNDESIHWLRENRGQKAIDAIDPELLESMDGTTVIGSKTNYVNKGKYCTFPHVIEVMAYNYKKVFQVLQYTKGLEAKISPFASALEGGAMEQLQGQIASAQIPMGKFVSPALYWVMTGDDFTLDINNPDAPKIVCMGNNPDRQTIYGTTLALYTSRMFKLINHKHKLKSIIILDELPTIFIKGLDNLIATARSNKVAIAFGAQDKSQLRRDYGDKEAEVIMTTTGNLFSGSVEGRTAEDISKAFGKEYRRRVSQTINDEGNSGSRSISYQLEDILPASKITDMTQGMFCGWMKDNFGDEIKRKKFCGAIDVDLERNKRLDAEAIQVPIITNMFPEGMPVMSDNDRERLQQIWPMLRDDEKALSKKFIEEKTNDVIMDNFNNVKKDVRIMIDAEFERTTPLAEAQREKDEMDDN